MTTSDAINELAAALAKAQAKMKGAAKDSENPHFRLKYADLASVREACLLHLNEAGICVVQSPRLMFDNGQCLVDLETRLIHTSGQWLTDSLSVPVTKVDAQGVGSAITYARRYALAAFAGIAPADDDGEGAVGRQAPPKAAPAVKAPTGVEDWIDTLIAVADEGTVALEKLWKGSRADYRAFVTTHHADKWTKLKAIAASVSVAE